MRKINKKTVGAFLAGFTLVGAVAYGKKSYDAMEQTHIGPEDTFVSGFIKGFKQSYSKTKTQVPVKIGKTFSVSIVDPYQ